MNRLKFQRYFSTVTHIKSLIKAHWCDNYLTDKIFVFLRFLLSLSNSPGWSFINNYRLLLVLKMIKEERKKEKCEWFPQEDGRRNQLPFTMKIKVLWVDLYRNRKQRKRKIAWRRKKSIPGIKWKNCEVWSEKLSLNCCA